MNSEKKRNDTLWAAGVSYDLKTKSILLHMRGGNVKEKLLEHLYK